MRNIAREPRTYELLTILSPEVPEEEIADAIERISGYVTSVGGTLEETVRESPWGRRRLAYPIRHGGRDVRDGFYTLFRLNLGPERVEEMERELKLNTQVMRYLVTSFTPKVLDPRAIEDAEVAAEDAAAAAYAEAQAEAARLTVQNAAAEAAEAGAMSADAATEAPAADTDEVAEAPAIAEEAAADTDAEAPAEAEAADAPVAEQSEAADEPIAEGSESAAPESGAPETDTADAASDEATSPEKTEES